MRAYVSINASASSRDSPGGEFRFFENIGPRRSVKWNNAEIEQQRLPEFSRTTPRRRGRGWRLRPRRRGAAPPA
jgi:hypothetical protein